MFVTAGGDMAVGADEEVTEGGWFIVAMKRRRLRRCEEWGVAQLRRCLNNEIYVLIPTVDPVLCASGRRSASSGLLRPVLITSCSCTFPARFQRHPLNIFSFIKKKFNTLF